MQIGITVDWHTYPKQSHITSDVEFRDIEKWLVATRERTNEKERYVQSTTPTHRNAAFVHTSSTHRSQPSLQCGAPLTQ
jgi:hypothetical protein